MSGIPRDRRNQVWARDLNRCVRCGGGGAQWHHRRGRSVIDQHTHCSCNGVIVCPSCHAWAHSHPTTAMELGLIVLRSVAEPGYVPVVTFAGTWLLDCHGGGKAYVENAGQSE